MNLVKLAAKMPDSAATNGLEDLAKELIDEPAVIRFACVWFDTKSVMTDTDTGDVVPTVRVRRWEPLGTVADIPLQIRREVEAAAERRSGETSLPFDVVEAGTEW